MTDNEFDDILKNAVKIHGKDYFEDSAPPHQFSDNFNDKMEKLIHKRKKKGRIIKIICSAAAVVVLSVVSVRLLVMPNIDTLFPSAEKIQTAEISSAPDNISSADTDTQTNDNDIMNNDAAEDYAAEDTDNAISNYSKSITAEQNNAAVDSIQADDNVAGSAMQESQDAKYLASVSHNGQETSLDENKSYQLGNYITDILASENVIIDSEEDTVSLNSDKSQYSISLQVFSETPIITDESGNIITSLTIILNEDKGCLVSSQMDSVYSFTLLFPENFYSELEKILTS